MKLYNQGKAEQLLTNVVATGASKSIDLADYDGCAISINQTGTPTATVQVEYSLDNVSFFPFDNGVFGTAGTDSNDLYTINAKIPYVRVNVTAYTAGAINAFIFSNTL